MPTSPLTDPPFQPLSERVRRFRAAALVRGEAQPTSPKPENFGRAFFDLYSRRPIWERYARSMAYALEREPVHLFDDENLAGMVYAANASRLDTSTLGERWKPFSARKNTVRRSAGISPYVGTGGWGGHVGWRWDVILERGVQGHMRHIRGLLDRAPDSRARRLYRGALIMWRAALRWADRHVEAIRQKAESSAAAERKRLLRLAAMCRRVPRKPARTFREAMQAFYMQHLIVMYENPQGGNGPGRLDYFLWPYLEQDLDAGRITEAEAKDLVDDLVIRGHERLHPIDGWVEGVMAGGSNPDGSSALNPLSYMLVESIGALDQTHPSVYTRVAATDPDDWIDLNVRYLLRGGNRAQIYNERASMQAVEKSGVPTEDAAMFMGGGCMEISCQGMACDMNFARWVNMAKTFELTLNAGVDLLTGEKHIPFDRSLPDYADFEDLFRAFESVLGRFFNELCRAFDIASECYAKWRPRYLLSSLILDCLERGREQHDGGARYHDYGIALLGVTSVADALNAIRRAVYLERFVSAEDLLAALRANYEGHEALRRRLDAMPRYGVQDPDADEMANRVWRVVCGIAARTRNRFNGRLKPMAFNFLWTPLVSKALGARADGQLAGARVGHGVTPQQKAMTRGVTAAMNSCLSLDHELASGGATTMWDVDPDWVNPDIMKALLMRFLKDGGMIFQGNATSVKELEDALARPDRYPNLMVRVGGFSARFVTLSPEVQQEIVTRRRHSG